MSIYTNDLKKGHEIRLRNGWYGIIHDNKRGNIRLVEVQGIYTEIGSIYAHDIVEARIDGSWQPVSHTPKQRKFRKQLNTVYQLSAL